jgi:hypothetical protein
MIMGMSDEKAQAFLEKISATAIANQAVLKCIVLGLPLDVDNVILCVGDFVDPDNPNFAGLIEEIEKAIVHTVQNGAVNFGRGPGHAS